MCTGIVISYYIISLYLYTPTIFLYYYCYYYYTYIARVGSCYRYRPGRLHCTILSSRNALQRLESRKSVHMPYIYILYYILYARPGLSLSVYKRIIIILYTYAYVYTIYISYIPFEEHRRLLFAR